VRALRATMQAFQARISCVYQWNTTSISQCNN